MHRYPWHVRLRLWHSRKTGHPTRDPRVKSAELLTRAEALGYKRADPKHPRPPRKDTH